MAIERMAEGAARNFAASLAVGKSMVRLSWGLMTITGVVRMCEVCGSSVVVALEGMNQKFVVWEISNREGWHAERIG